MEKYNDYVILQEKGQKSRKKSKLKKKRAKAKKAKKIKPSKDKPLMAKLLKEWGSSLKGYEKGVASFMEENDITINGINDINEGNYGYGIVVDTDEGEYWFLSDNEADYAAKEDVKDLIEMEGPQHIRGYEDFAYISPTDIRLIAGDDSDSLREDLEYENESLDEEDQVSDEDIDSQVDDKYEEVKSALEKDFVDYFVNEQGIYSEEDLMKQNFVNIDEDELADYVIRTDGRANTLSRYDGEEYEAGDTIYYRVN